LFPHPERSNTVDYYDMCWSGSETTGLFAQEFVAKCNDDGWATIRMTGGEDEAVGGKARFQHFVDVVEPLCTDRQERPDFNPQKRCYWEFQIPCTCDDQQRRSLLSSTTEQQQDDDDCRAQSLVADIHSVPVDKCVTKVRNETLQIISQNITSVTFTISQTWKGCENFYEHDHERERLGWIATDYINTQGELLCEKQSDLQCGMVETYTALCTGDIAVVDLYSFDDELFGQTDGTDLTPPIACGADKKQKGRRKNNKCHFRYILNCAPSLCSHDNNELEEENDNNNVNEKLDNSSGKALGLLW